MFRKGQTFTADFVLSVFIFFIILGISVILWNSAQMKSEALQETRLMASRAFYITEMLLKTEGYPPGWNETDVRLLGLADSRRNIDIARLNAMMNLSEENISAVWNIEEYGFNFSINASGLYYTKGAPVDFSADFVFPMKRIVLVNDSGVLKRGTLTLVLWK